MASEEILCNPSNRSKINHVLIISEENGEEGDEENDKTSRRTMTVDEEEEEKSSSTRANVEAKGTTTMVCSFN